jgi:hypothetical protein
MKINTVKEQVLENMRRNFNVHVLLESHSGKDSVCKNIGVSIYFVCFRIESLHPLG